MKANRFVRSDVDSHFWLEYTDIRVGMPTRKGEEQAPVRQHGQPAPKSVRSTELKNQVTPNECRLRDMTYAAEIVVDIKYTKGRIIGTRKNVIIGRIPIMLRSSKCYLTDQSDKELARMDECALDPGGYFIVNGAEKVILVQEQLSKNRVLVDTEKGATFAHVTRYVSFPYHSKINTKFS